MIERTPDGNQRVQAYGLDVLLLEVQELIQRGYELDYNTNEHFPQQIGHIYVVTLVPRQKGKGIAGECGGPELVFPAEARTDKPMPEVTPELKALQAVIEEGKKPGRKPKVTA